MEANENVFDVVIVGGSYAGLSAAMALGRARRKVLIVDAGQPCNAQTPHSHNFLTQDGNTPTEISTIAKEQVLQYRSVTFLNDFVDVARKQDDLFYLTTRTGKEILSHKILLATGVKDLFPDIEGLKECWGISVLHCPYCHGYEVRDKRFGILADGANAIEFTRLLKQWSTELVLLTNGTSSLTIEQKELLSSANVPVVESEVRKIIHNKGHLQRLEFEDREPIILDAMFARLNFTQHSSLVEDLGCHLSEMNLILKDDFGKTNVPGVYAAGDCCLPMRSISMAVASGTMAGAAINRELIDLSDLIIATRSA